MAGFENTAGIGVNNYYGARNTGGSVGVERSDDALHQLSIQFTGTSINQAYLPPFVLPRGAQIKRYILRIDEAFVVTAAGTLTFGGTVPGTNGVVLTKAELEAIGTKTPASTGTGTWAVASATGTTAAEKVTRAISGTITTGVGKGVLVAEYFFKTKV